MTELKQRRGFALLSPAERREMASRAGKAAHEQGRAHVWDKDTATAAGAKGLAARGIAIVEPQPVTAPAPAQTKE